MRKTVDKLRRAAIAAAFTAATLVAVRAQDRPAGQGFTFRTAVELISVTVTVTDERGRFVPGLKQEDFVLYEDGKPQTISQFDNERVPVSLGLALDTSGSMVGEKIVAAQAALNRFLVDLLGPSDQVFLYRFDSRATLIQPWTTDRRAAARALGTVRPNGGTAIYDTVAEAIPLAQSGTNQKKALVVISDGNDMNSRIGVSEVQQLIRQSEVLVYAIAIDASNGGSYSSGSSGSSGGGANTPKTLPQPQAFPGTKPPVPPTTVSPPTSGGSRRPSGSSSDRVNPSALRAITDDTGGRTEVIVSPRDLDPATAGIADELSRQYFLGYVSSLPKDGRWHAIEVRVKKGNYTIRARKGFVAGT